MSSTEQVIVPAEESVPRDRLSGLPNEILLEIFPHLDTWIDSLNLSKASTRYYKPLLCQLYKESDWYPFCIAVQTENTATLDRCHEFGAPLDSPLQLTRGDDYPGARPLIFAIRHYQLAAVEWLLAHGADPSDSDIFQEAPSRWMVLSPLQIARELPEKIMIPEEEEQDSDAIISGISASPSSLSRWIRVSRVVTKSKIIAALERAGSRDYPLHLMIGSQEAE